MRYTSQSLLNEVLFPTYQGERIDLSPDESQSLLNEVLFPTANAISVPKTTLNPSQSLLNEVLFPT